MKVIRTLPSSTYFAANCIPADSGLQKQESHGSMQSPSILKMSKSI